jgi:hypothetical protein
MDYNYIELDDQDTQQVQHVQNKQRALRITDQLYDALVKQLRIQVLPLMDKLNFQELFEWLYPEFVEEIPI